MAITTYQPLLKVGLQHAYYVQHVSRDFAVRPTSATAKFLKRHQIRFGASKTPNFAGFDLLFVATTGRTPARALPADFRLNFLLFLEDKTLLNVSELSAPGAGMVHYYGVDDLATDPDTLSNLPPQTMPVRGSHFMHRFSKPAGAGSTANPETVEVRDARDSSVMATYTATPDAQNNYSIEMRLHDLPEGCYELIYASYTSLNERFYLSDEAKQSAPFAVIELGQASGAWDYGAIPGYYLQMAARTAVWHYWFAREGGIAINYDQRLSGALGPYPASVYLHPALDLSSYAYLSTDAYTETLALLEARYPTATVELWVTADGSNPSTAAVLSLPYYELPRAGLAMRWTVLDEYIYESLPVPERKRLSPEHVLFIPEVS